VNSLSAAERLFVSGGMDPDAMHAAGIDDADMAAVMAGHQHGAIAHNYNVYFAAVSCAVMLWCAVEVISKATIKNPRFGKATKAFWCVYRGEENCDLR